MAIDSKIPEIALLKEAVEKSFGLTPRVHSDFEMLSDSIFAVTREHVSETTLERIWGYSTRGYDSVSRRILNILAAYNQAGNWDGFLERLKREAESESDMFNRETVRSSDLKPGARIRIGWPPDRECIIRYTGCNRYVAEEARNAKLQPGDTFSCIQFQLLQPNYLDELRGADGSLKGQRYGIGLHHGLTTLCLLPSDQ